MKRNIENVLSGFPAGAPKSTGVKGNDTANHDERAVVKGNDTANHDEMAIVKHDAEAHAKPSGADTVNTNRNVSMEDQAAVAKLSGQTVPKLFNMFQRIYIHIFEQTIFS